jgi:hypothetical protein
MKVMSDWASFFIQILKFVAIKGDKTMTKPIHTIAGAGNVR